MLVPTTGRPVEVRESIEDPRYGLTGANLLNYIDRNNQTYTGKTVTPQSAISGTIAVYACVNVLARAIGGLPLKLYRMSGEERREVPERADYPGRLARMLHQMPNSEMTAQEFWSLVTTHICLWGNFYANVERGQDGKPVALWPLDPSKTAVGRITEGEFRNQKFWRTYLPDGTKRDLFRDEVMHLRNPIASDGTGLVGLSPIMVARNSIANTQAMTEFTGRFWQNDATPTFMLVSPKPLSADQSAAMRRDWEANQGGLKNKSRIAILHSGLTVETLGMPLDDAQFVESQKWELAQSARVFGIPPHKVGDLERATFSNIEHQAIEWVTDTITPYLVNYEQGMNRDLGMPESGRTLRDTGLFPEFLVDGLLRGDVKSRWEAYGLAISNRVLSPADVARIENYAPNDDRPATYENPNTTSDASSLTVPGGSN